MKKGWKITLISLGSVVGLVVVVVAVAMWLVFTPKQLTKIVNGLADRFVTCEARFGRVDLTLLSTFPDAGLKVEDVVVVNPTDGAPSDTVARIGSLTVGLDVKAFLKQRQIIVHQVLLDGVQANLYIAPDGRSNFDIFPSDTTDKDTSQGSFEMPQVVNIEKVRLSDINALLQDERDSLVAAVEGLDLSLKGSLTDSLVDARLEVEGREVRLRQGARLDATLSRLVAELRCAGTPEEAEGRLELSVKDGLLYSDSVALITDAMRGAKHGLLSLAVPFRASLDSGRVALSRADLTLCDHALWLQGSAQLPTDSLPMGVDVEVATDGPWQVKPLIALLPASMVPEVLGHMDMDARVDLRATAVGSLTDSTMPVVDATVTIADGSLLYKEVIPYKVDRIKGDVAAHIDLSRGATSHASVNSLSLRAANTNLSLMGRADDLTGDMRIDATVKGNTVLADLRPMLPADMPLAMEGKANIDLHANLAMSQLQAMALEKMKASGTVRLSGLDLTYDSIHAEAPSLDVALQLPATVHRGKLADVHVTGGSLAVAMEGQGVKASVDKPDIAIGVNNITKSQVEAAFEVAVGETEATVDSMLVSLGALTVKGSVRLDSTQTNVLRQFNPVADIDMHSAVLYMPALPDAVRMSQLEVSYNDKDLDIKKAEVKLGMSDFSLHGTIHDAEAWMSGEKVLTGDLHFTSGYTDVDQLMNMVSGMGSDADSLQIMREEDNVPAEANPFIVPRDVDVTLYTHIQRCIAFSNDLSDVAGTLTIRDGKAILDQMGFVCKAATMQLTALYESPRPNNLFVSLDFHLLDIQIDELLDMIPSVDTLVPMLAAFNGNANFHLAAETFLDARYQPKMSSLLGSAAISGKNLVVLDDANISQIAKLMQFKSWKEKDNKIRIDSLDVEMSCFRKEIEVYPFLLSIGKYQLCIAGKHNLDNLCNYHVELLKNPLLAKVGVDIKGSLDKPKISLGEVRYSDLYKPAKQGVVEKRVLETKNRIRKALEANVR